MEIGAVLIHDASELDAAFAAMRSDWLARRRDRPAEPAAKARRPIGVELSDTIRLRVSLFRR
jgi:hypothetical protein